MDTKTTSAVVSDAVPLTAAAVVPPTAPAPADAAAPVEKDTAEKDSGEKDTAEKDTAEKDTAEKDSGDAHDTAGVGDAPGLPPFGHMDDAPSLGLLVLILGLAAALARKVKALTVDHGFAQVLNVAELKRLSAALAKAEGQVADMQNALARIDAIEEALKSRPKAR